MLRLVALANQGIALMDTGVTLVEDSEVLYRRVPCDPELFVQEGDKLVVQPAAFRDRNNRPSVDRAVLRGFNPLLTQQGPGAPDGWQRSGVIRLIAGRVRSVSPLVQKDNKGRDVGQHHVDVIPRPCPPEDASNVSHARVEAEPRIESNNLFRRLREALARVVDGWEIPPDGYR